jgi:hypothetical protein
MCLLQAPHPRVQCVIEISYRRDDPPLLFERGKRNRLCPYILVEDGWITLPRPRF